MARRPEVTLPSGGPFVSTEVDPNKIHGVAAYAAGIQARRGGALPKQEMPLNQPRPLIPNLAGGPAGGPGGGTMADFARMERQAAAASYITMPTGGIIEEAAPPVAAAAVRPTAASLGLAPMDLLPPSAKDDPAYVAGHGSEFASNQPMLAAKYGVVRNGVFVPPQKLGGGRPALSPKTIQDLQKLKELSEGAAAPGLDQNDAEARRAVENGMGGAAARVGNEPGDNSTRVVSDKEREDALKSAIDRMDAFEFNQWRQLTMRQILHSDDERKLIESRLKPLDVGDLIRDGVIRQRVPIVPGRYEITLQNYDGETDIALKRLVMQESKSLDVGEQYHLDKYGFMQVAVGIHKVNDKEFPTVMDDKGHFNDDLFLKKFNMVMKLPLDMLASIGINLFWFSVRVRKLYSASAVGNG